VIALALWVAEYYACGAGDAIAVAMPPRALAGTRAAAFRTIRVAHLTVRGHEIAAGGPPADAVVAAVNGRRSSCWHPRRKASTPRRWRGEGSLPGP